MSDDVKRCIPFDRAIVFIEYISTGKYLIHFLASPGDSELLRVVVNNRTSCVVLYMKHASSPV